MNTIKQKITILTTTLLVAIAIPVVALAFSSPVNAAECGGVETSIISCDETNESGEVEDTGLWAILIMSINVLSAGVGVIALAGIVYGSVLYTSAGGSQEQVKKAMGIISNVVIGIIAYALMFSALNFLIPGGLFN